MLGVDIGGITKAYPFSALSDSPVVNDTVGGAHMLVYLDASSGTALAYDRRVNGTPLTFRLEGEPNGILTILVDEQTNSRWMAFTGAAIEGELKGQKLERALSHLSFWFAWKDWNPDTELYQG